MRKNLVKVLEAFVQGKEAHGDSKWTISTDGLMIWSYDMPIVQKMKDGRIEVLRSDLAPTATTKAQVRGAYLWLRDENWRQATGSKHSTHYSVTYVNTLRGLKDYVFKSKAGPTGYQP